LKVTLNTTTPFLYEIGDRTGQSKTKPEFDIEYIHQNKPTIRSSKYISPISQIKIISVSNE